MVIHSEQGKADNGDRKTIPQGGGNGGVETIAVPHGQGGGKEDSNSKSGVNKTLDSDVANEVNGKKNYTASGHNQYIQAMRARALLPRPEPPKPRVERSQSFSIAGSMPLIGKYIRERSTSFSAAVLNHLSSLQEDAAAGGDFPFRNDPSNLEVTEFKIPGVKVIVKLKGEEERFEDQIKGRITLFTKSNCENCIAARKLFKEKGCPYVEINTDVLTRKAEELIERTGDAEVPKIFFNDCLIGGLETLKSWSESGELEEKMRELLGPKCPEEAPEASDYGINDEEEEEDELLEVVNHLRRSLQIQDRLIKMKMVKNCFAGTDMVEAIINYLDCGRRKGIATAKMMAQKHFIHHVFGENEFENGNHYYRFLEHEPFITGCFNFRTLTNDNEPKTASFIADRLSKLMFAILEMDGYVSDNRLHVDYLAISKSQEFRRYNKLTRDLQRINLKTLTPNESLSFFLNLYNAMVIHAVISIGHPEGVVDNKAFFLDFQYLVPMKLNPLIHFGLCKGTISSPKLRFFTAQNVEEELKTAAMEYFQNEGIEIDWEQRTVYLTRIIKWFSTDFGETDKDILLWVLNYLDGRNAKLLMDLLADEQDTLTIVYQDYDWSGNL
ncbi:hypothetical protein V6N13_099865 [Hibiscus sabdariffa]